MTHQQNYSWQVWRIGAELFHSGSGGEKMKLSVAPHDVDAQGVGTASSSLPVKFTVPPTTAARLMVCEKVMSPEKVEVTAAAPPKLTAPLVVFNTLMLRAKVIAVSVSTAAFAPVVVGLTITAAVDVPRAFALPTKTEPF
jgi:hypothetical protein